MAQVSAIFFQFQETGDNLAGEYLGSRPIQWQDGKPGLVHYIRDLETGDVYNFNGTYKLNEDLYRVPMGTHVDITLTGASGTRRGQNPVKLFSIVADGVSADIAGLGNNPPPEAFQPPLPLLNAPPENRPYQVGGMPAPRMADIPRPMTVENPRPRYPQQPIAVPGPLAYTADRRPIYGYTPDGNPLDINGYTIPGAGRAAMHPTYEENLVSERNPVAYTPDGDAIYGYTPDGDALDANGRIIPQAYQG